MHHKRKRPKSRRAGCLLCKPWKRQGAKRSSKFSNAAEKRERVRKREMRNT